MPNRRTVMICLGGLAVGGGALISTGAFDTVDAERAVSIEATGDANAFLGLQIRADLDAGEERIDLDFDGGGFNLEARTVLERVLLVQNNGTQDEIGVEVDDVVINGEGFELEGDEATDLFSLDINGEDGTFNGSDGDIDVEPDPDTPNVINVGEAMTFDLVVDLRTGQLSGGPELFAENLDGNSAFDVTFTITASQDASGEGAPENGDNEASSVLMDNIPDAGSGLYLGGELDNDDVWSNSDNLDVENFEEREYNTKVGVYTAGNVDVQNFDMKENDDDVFIYTVGDFVVENNLDLLDIGGNVHIFVGGNADIGSLDFSTDTIGGDLIIYEDGENNYGSLNGEENRRRDVADWPKAFRIENWSQLNDVRDGLRASYVLSNDLDTDSAGYDTYGSDWNPIETFEGSFDGQGHTITGLTGKNGLFSKIDGATIKDVTLDKVDISQEGDQIGGLVGEVGENNKSTISGVNLMGSVNGEQETGGLIGRNRGADVSNSSTTGSIPDGEGGVQGGLVGYEAGGNTYSDVHTEMEVSLDYGEENNIGGLIGLFDDYETGGSITGSHATGDVLGENDVGGLIGRNLAADVTDSYATGNIPGGEGQKVGGLVGYETGSNTYTRVYATGNVSPEHDEEINIGGLIGIFDDSETGGSITDAYATGDVYGDSYLGGLIGRNRGADVTNTYATGWVRDRDDSGGLIGSDKGGSYSNSFWDTETSEKGDSDGGDGLETDDMQGDAATENMDGFDFDGIWNIDDDDYPILR